MYQQNNSRVNRIVLFLLFILIFANSIFSISYSEKNYEVSERELLILTLITYSNTVKCANTSASDILTKELLERWEMSDKTLSPDDVEGWKIVGYEINTLKNKDGFSVFTFKKDDNIVIIPRGTDEGLFRENWKYLFCDEHPQAKHMKFYIENVIIPFLTKYEKKENYKIYICGHSLGGYLALYGAGLILGNSEISKHLAKIVTFNGLGLDKSTNRDILLRLRRLPPEKIVNYRIGGDSVSLVGEHFTKPISLKLIHSPFLRQPSKWLFIIGYTLFAHRLSQFFLHNPFIFDPNKEKERRVIRETPISEEVKQILKEYSQSGKSLSLPKSSLADKYFNVKAG